MIKKSILLITLFSITACANPEVAEKRQAGDTKLSCKQIEREIRGADDLEKAARDEKGVTGTNVAAALFFWPAMLVTYDNANDAIEAAKDRKKYLYDLAEDKGCDI